MRLEMHAHDCEVSPCAVIKAKELVDGYKEAGYDGIVITNHFDKGIMHLWGETTEEHYQTYLRGYELAKEEGERVGLRVILGMEIRLECGPEDYLVYGVTKDFIREHMDICGCSLQELYEICEENGCVLIQAHPFREYCQIQNPKYLHGVERNFNSVSDFLFLMGLSDTPPASDQMFPVYFPDFQTLISYGFSRLFHGFFRLWLTPDGSPCPGL